MMLDIELNALSMLVQRETAEMVAANVERLANGYSQAYSDFETDSSRALRRELVERKILTEDVQQKA